MEWNKISNNSTLVVIYQSQRGIIYTAAVATEMCLGQDSQTEPILIQFWFEFRVLFLLHWLISKAKQLSLPCYLTYTLRKKEPGFLQSYQGWGENLMKLNRMEYELASPISFLLNVVYSDGYHNIHYSIRLYLVKFTWGGI